MNYLKSIMVAAMLMLAPAVAYAQEAPAQCVSVEQFIAKAKDNNPDFAKKLVTLTGDTLNAFAANMDRISGGGHSDMDAIVMLDPSQNENDITMLAIFNNHCFVGLAQVPTGMVKQALNGLSV